LYEARKYPREGDERLSARKRAETEGAKDSRRSKNSAPSGTDSGRGGNGRGGRKGKTELGRALRSIYDDTLREPVPDDILGLIGKLS
jgi:hypothetical protein